MIEPVQATAAAFIQRWQGVTASELATSQSFIIELCVLLGVDAPHPTPDKAYMFERPLKEHLGDGSQADRRVDCYRRGHFVLESKKLKLAQHTQGFDDALLRARAQAEAYARAVPAAEGRPPFVLVVDVGNVIEVYAEFTRSGANYTPFPDPRSHRLQLADLARADVRNTLRAIWLDPESLNPARASARVTRDVAARLADLARSLEQSGHKPDHVAAFLTRALFSMFAEDVELLPKGSFLGLLQTHRAQPAHLQLMLRALWADMDQGGFSAALATQVLKFNGKLFKQPSSDGYSLLLNTEQIDRLIDAAKSKWNEVEPAIFGTLLERALNTTERHALGAHYTPRAYVERLVLPTVVEPLRADWANAQAAALVLAHEAAELSGKAHAQKMAEARAEIRKFHHQLCSTRVLDPACGSGNFLYVTLEHLKRLEGEVLNQLEALGETQALLGLEGETVTPQQLLGIELNERAAALAELVLWIGYLQWHIRTRGNKAVAEPVVHDYGNIEHRDAVLQSDDAELAYDDGPHGSGQLLTRWDGASFKPHPVTGALVPDEAAQVPQWKYIKPRQAAWPQADFIVGNPPFIGASTMRAALGDGYVQALRSAWKEVPESADFVMYWWSRASALVAFGFTRRFGLITTNSLRQTFNRRVVQAAMDGKSVLPANNSVRPSRPTVRPELVEGLQGSKGSPVAGASSVALVFAIADHPWVDSANGAAVRIAMTVAANPIAELGSDPSPQGAGSDPNFEGQSLGRLLTVSDEQTGEFGEVTVTLTERRGKIHADLTVGANVSAALPLTACGGMTYRGVTLMGSGFWVEPGDALVQDEPKAIRPLSNGRDLTDVPRGMFAIDFFGLSQDEARARFPGAYQRVLQGVKPERDQSQRASYRERWWLFAEARPDMRRALKGLARYIATPMTAKHRSFQFLSGNVMPDQGLIVVATGDAFHLGILSSQIHGAWALSAGGRLGVGNDPRYNNSRCFETFPFPDTDTSLTPNLRARIADMAEQIDAHRKRVLSTAKGLTLTGLYNVMQALNEGRALTAKEKAINEQGQVGVLKDLHDELDAAVLAAYGWEDLNGSLRPFDGLGAGQAQGERGGGDLLTRLVALNLKRANEEKTGLVRWLRPEFQNPAARQSLQNNELTDHIPRGLQADFSLSVPQEAAKTAIQPWPATLPEQVRAVAQLLASSATALPVAAIEASFKGKGGWKKGLPRILDTLEALGRARREGALWRG